ncbi:MAG: hypothetical protein GVY23_04855 [Spirochaetes bacterium]|jgi:hypothetical protein|nr:hypothetical protein [Spirochaetota bacterium]
MQPRWDFDEKDLRFLAGFFMPQRVDVDRVVAMLREDEDIVDGMVADPSLADHLLQNPEPIVDLTPRLLFAVLLIRAREDLRTRPFTFEKSTNRMMVIFDTKLILELLAQKPVLVYLSGMLSSFSRVRSVSVTIPVRPGIWRRYSFSDFDVESLIRFGEVADEAHRFAVYKRIADLCLFTVSIFPEYLLPTVAGEGGTRRVVRNREKKRIEDYQECGKYFYKEAARLPDPDADEARPVLAELSEKFEIATKPLGFLADHYLGSLRTKTFSPGPGAE